MKLLKYIPILLLMVVMTGCEDYFGENANVDPDNPTSATVNVLLPQVQARLAYVYGGDFTRYLGVNTQQVDGVGRQFAVIGNYGIVPSDVDAAWRNIYSGCLNSNKVMKNLAIESGSNHYQAAAMVLEAFAIMNATDFWGDIPYSDATKFGENGGVYAPTVDKQEDIYTALFSNLATAISLFAGDDGGNPMGSDDLIYGGDAAKWGKFASALMARGKLHLSKVNSSNYNDVLSALANGFSTMDDAATFAFGEAATENAPWFQYIEQRDDCEVGATYVALMESLNDPRVATYGAEHALPHPVFIGAQNLPLISFSEQEFMKAEAMMATGDAAGAFTAFESGVAASMAEGLAGIDSVSYNGATVAVDAALISTYIADNYGTSVTMDGIMTQKYISMNTSPEAFNDWRRTGIPSLTAINGSEIPRRLPYSEAEQFANGNIPTPAQISIFDRVWWDQ